MEFWKHSWAEINLDNALYNFNKIKEKAANRAIIPVVKADAYGHGADILADLYAQNGATAFAVSNLNEAIKLRMHGINKDILILGFSPISSIDKISKYNITQTVFCKEYAEELSAAAKNKNVTIKTHIKIDTGMGRLGFNCRKDFDSQLDDIISCISLPNLNFEGIFTHFSSADSFNNDDVEFSNKQYDTFNKLVNALKENGITFKYVHCANSAGTALRSATEGNLIRPGIILYGVSPADNINTGFDLKPVMSIKTVVSMVKEIEPNEALSYGRTYISKSKMKIATLPIGYADGYPRVMSNKGHVIINGKFANIVGRVCMDQMLVDVTDIEDVATGTEVTVIGTNGNLSITFDEIAKADNTIPYEIMCGTSVRMPRVYIKNSKIEKVLHLGGVL